MYKKVSIFIILIIIFFMQSLYAADIKINYQDEQAFIDAMVNTYHFNRNYITDLIYRAHVLPAVIVQMQHPYEAKPWYIYREHFITPERVQQGIIYWQQHAKNLARATKKYEVPANIIVAIVGVESFYGDELGEYPVLDTLATLSFAYPPRAQFFQSELAQYFLLIQELHFNPEKLYGSYAGAMGLPQFIPSSYRYYAIGQKDLFHDTPDVIFSVGNYLEQAGWEGDEQIAVPAKIIGNKYKQLLNEDLKTKYTVAMLKKYGVTPKQKLSANTKVNLIRLQNRNGYEYWLGLHNFYVITRYNLSIHYAMVVYQLAEEINKAK
jgi:membrane-bound lytic murein transglycosylase B